LLEIEGVSKRYKSSDSFALQDYSLDVNPGILGLLGPNGAGKSTLMRIIATITKPSMGSVTWRGSDIAKRPDDIRKVLGYLPQDFGVYPNLNADEFLGYMAAVKGVDRRAALGRIDELIAFVNLVEARKRPLGSYSGGMKQRIGVAQALLNDPEILVVDEPTVGLDPEGRVRFRHLLAELSGDRVVILSTHIVSDVEAVANDIAIMNMGRLVRRSSPEELLRLVEERVWEWVIPSSDLQAVRKRHLLSSVIRHSDGVHVRVVSEESPGSGAMLVDHPSLEEAYLYCIESHRGGEAV